MRAVKLKLVKPEETLPPTPPMDWRPVGRVVWVILSWLVWLLWEITKLTVIVVGVMIGVTLIVIGFLTHFVGGPPRSY
jgi:hypothetical protein